jgi:hypothetical protein
MEDRYLHDMAYYCDTETYTAALLPSVTGMKKKEMHTELRCIFFSEKKMASWKTEKEMRGHH